MSKVYDCFTFFNELELLELRLHELDPVVDQFVLVEAALTHSYHPKPLHFAEHKARFEKFLPKITYIVVTEFPEAGGNRWVAENYQRNAIARGLQECKPDDVIIVSDIDEIVRARAVLENKDKPGIKFFRQQQYYYYLNCAQKQGIWDRAKMAFYRDLRSPQWLRDYPKPSVPHPTRWQKKIAKYRHRWRQRFRSPDIFIDNGGWHFSYLGGLERIREKIKAFAHSEYDNEEFLALERLERVLATGEDLYGRRNMAFEFVPIDDSFPRYLREHPERYENMVRVVDAS